MNLGNILKRGDNLKRAFVNLENGMSEAIEAEFLLPHGEETEAPASRSEAPAEPAVDHELADELEAALPDLEDEVEEEEQAPVEVAQQDDRERLTSHTQNRLAALASFERAYRESHEDLTRISSALASVVAMHNLSREFLGNCQADIVRANELEIANSDLSFENRQLSDRVEKLERLRSRYETLVEAMKRREVKLLQDIDVLRISLGQAKLETVEARNVIARNELAQSELHNSLAARTSQAERLLRDNEVLREKTANLSLELDSALKKQTEMRRRLDELAAAHAQQSALHAEVSAKLASEEKDVARLQKHADVLEARLVETTEALRNLELESSEQERRYQTEIHALRSEVQTLSSRLHDMTAEQMEAANRAALLTSRIADLESEKRMAEQKLAGFSVEADTGKTLPAAANNQPQDASLVEAQAREIEEMRGRIETLTATVERLSPFEPANDRSHGKRSNGHATETVVEVEEEEEVLVKVAS